MSLNFDTLFRAATGNAPYAYQRRLACGELFQGSDPVSAVHAAALCISRLINIPTGLGKTAAVVLAWLWNRIIHSDEVHRSTWPRRLVYCLPMRTLVEQTHDNIQFWILRLALAATENGSSERAEIEAEIERRATTIKEDAERQRWRKSIRAPWGPDKRAIEESLVRELAQARASLVWMATNSPIILMGGEDLDDARRNWDIYPEKPAILIGTQDMLLSRALNRGYGMARARWPMHFGLLNNDALWILDETQLMGVGARTSAQLEGLRKKIGTALHGATWWTSATLDSRLLTTRDHLVLPPTLTLSATDRSSPEVSARVASVKHLASLPITLKGESSKLVAPYIDSLASTVLEKHQPGTTTLVILNRVDRSKDLCTALAKLAKKHPLPERVLIHSRFRPMERGALSTRIKEPGEKIIIATQAIEAGVDISARTLITELAPWSSLIQRFGRCNRQGEFNTTGGADIFWLNLEADDSKNAPCLARPYTSEQLDTARGLLLQAEATGVSPAALEALRAEEPLPETHLLRRKDLVDLFDTTPDLAGLDLDVGRYIRDDEERDVQVFWRQLPSKPEPSDLDAIVPQRRELVRIALYGSAGFEKFTKNDKSKSGIWLWNVLDGEWQPLRADRIAPGQIYLINASLGGYSTTLGWIGEKSKEDFLTLTVAEQTACSTPRDGQDTDDESQRQTSPEPWQTIEEHTTHVVAATRELIAHLPAAQPWNDALTTAAQWHDVGKTHPTFQRFLSEGRDVPEAYKSSYLAKSTRRPGVRFDRPHFRHELASALTWLQAGSSGDTVFVNLVAYLIATHHGKVRLSLRAMPGEKAPASGDERQTPLFARGVWQADRLPADLTKTLNLEGVPATSHTFPVTLDLSCMQLGERDGRPSWTARMLSLRDSEALGIFRLAWLESLLRAADAEGSRRLT